MLKSFNITIKDCRLSVLVTKFILNLTIVTLKIKNNINIGSIGKNQLKLKMVSFIRNILKIN